MEDPLSPSYAKLGVQIVATNSVSRLPRQTRCPVTVSTDPSVVGVGVGLVVAARGLDNAVHGFDQVYSGGQESPTRGGQALGGLFGCAAAPWLELGLDLGADVGAGIGWSRLGNPGKWANRNCFPAGTPVAAERGAVPIEAVESGERVWSFDFRAGRWLLCRVALVHSAPYEGEVLTLGFEDGTSLEVTADHPIWVIEGDALASRPQLHFRDACEDSGFSLPGRWVHSQALRVGDQLYGQSGAQVRIRAILSRQESLPVYNLSVLGLPYYAVGPTGILVHNTESNIPAVNPAPQHGPAIRRGDTDMGDLVHYIWESPHGRSFDLLLDAEVSGDRLLIRDAHLMPSSGTFAESQSSLGLSGLRQLAQDLGEHFGVDVIELLNRITRPTGRSGGFGPGVFPL